MSTEDQGFADLMNGLSLGAGRRHRHRKPDEETPELFVGAEEPEWPHGEPGVIDHAPVDESAADEPDASLVRPYAWTRGRTRSTFELRVETMVSTSDRAADAYAFAESEHREIGALCAQPRSVAEVATLFGAPLGVAKVLLGDMAQLGLVTVHKTASGGANRSHLMLMERVLSGLRRL